MKRLTLSIDFFLGRGGSGQERSDGGWGADNPQKGTRIRRDQLNSSQSSAEGEMLPLPSSSRETELVCGE